MTNQPKCANSHRTVNGQPMCKPGTLGELVVTMNMAAAGESCGSSTEAFATYCRACATRLLNEVLEGMGAQAKHDR